MTIEYYKITKNDLNEILKTLLREKIVDKVLTSNAKKSFFEISPNLVSEEKDLDDYSINALFAHNFNRLDSASKYLHNKANGAYDDKIAMIGLPADGRAIVELSKLLQVDLNNIFVIILENLGVIIPKDLAKILKKKEIDKENVVDEWVTTNKLLLKLKDGKQIEIPFDKKFNFAESSLKDYRKIADENYDLAITYITLEPFSDELILKVGSEKGKQAIKKAKIELKSLDKSKIEELQDLQKELMNEAKKLREDELISYIKDEKRIKGIAKCTMCGMCINACPVCFCSDCILQKQRKEKVIDKLSYQLTRISHVGDRCVDCGKCSQTCPPALPLALYFEYLNDEIKKEFGYVAGEDPKLKGPRSQDSVKKIKAE